MLLAVVPFVVVLGAIGSIVDGLNVSWWCWLLCLWLGDGVYPLTKGYEEFVGLRGQFSEVELGLVGQVASDVLGQLAEKDCTCEEVWFVFLWVEGQNFL